MATTFDTQYHVYRYKYFRFLWIGWIVSRRTVADLLYFDDTKTAVMVPETNLDYVTFGFSGEAVFNKLKKYIENIREI